MGADDYITKPFSQRLLIERIRALLRRETGEDGAPGGEAAEAPLVCGELMLDPARHLCTWTVERISLTVTDFLILTSLAPLPGHVTNRSQDGRLGKGCVRSCRSRWSPYP